MNRHLLAALLALTLLTACASHSIVGDPNVQAEIDRVAALVQGGGLKETDLDGLVQLTSGDASAAHEIEELQLMVRHGENAHAAHALSFLSAYAQTGKEVLCPGHEIAHYYVFMRDGEKRAAEGALEEAQESLPAWREKAQEYSTQFPGPVSFEQADARISAALARIEGGDSAASEQEILALTTDSICVDED